MKTLLRKTPLACCLCIGLIAVNDTQSCYDGGGVTAWGSYYNGTFGIENYYPMSVPPGLTNAIAIAGGANHALALKSDGKVVAWGWNGYGQTDVPAGLSNVVSIAAAGDRSLALGSNGKVTAWGYLPTGAISNLALLSNIVGITSYHGLKADGTVVSLFGETVIPSGLDHVVSLAPGLGFLALKDNGTVVGWGQPLAYTNVPATVTNIVAVAAGTYGLALRQDGIVLAWGNNFYGETNVPPGLSNVVSIAAGYYHSLAVKTDGTVVAWGAGTNYLPFPNFSANKGQCMVPTGLTNVIAVAGGATFSLAITLAPATASSQFSLSVNVTNGIATLRWPSVSNQTYWVQYKSALTNTNWDELPGEVIATGPTASKTDVVVPETRFYRVRTQ